MYTIAMIVVPDTNTLIYLAKADLLDMLGRYEVWVGEKVYQETVETGKREGRADAFILEKYIQKHLERKTLEDQKAFKKEKVFFGGEGEADVFLLAKGRDCLVITSDLVARKKLKSRGVNVIRTDMLIFKQFQEGQLEKDKLYDKLVALRNVGGTTDERISFLLKKAEMEGDNHGQE